MSRCHGSPSLLAAARRAAAQDSAVKSAADAFGERVGTEQSGLYSETQVRGFDLNDSGAYRIDDAYFSRAAALNDPVLAGVGVRVGVNAVRLAYPAPSGVVNYRLRQAGPGERAAARRGLARLRHAGDPGRRLVSRRRFQPRRRVRLASVVAPGPGQRGPRPRRRRRRRMADRARPAAARLRDRCSSAATTATTRSSPARRPCRRASRQLHQYSPSWA